MTKFHSLTPLFARTITDRISLVSNHWSHYSLIQQLEAGSYPKPFPGTITKKVSSIENLYFTYKSSATNKINEVIEQNAVTYYGPLEEENVVISTYKPNIVLDTKTQAVPDLVFDDNPSPQLGIHNRKDV